MKNKNSKSIFIELSVEFASIEELYNQLVSNHNMRIIKHMSPYVYK